VNKNNKFNYVFWHIFCIFNIKLKDMKTLFKVITISAFLIGSNVWAQTPDQNPNYKESQNRYVEQKIELTKNQSQTIQDTYEAYDWTENKLKEKNARIQRRHEIRTMRHQRNNVCYSSHRHRNNYNNGYYNNGYNNNNGYYGNNYGGNNYSNPVTNIGNTLLTTAVLGTTLYYLLK